MADTSRRRRQAAEENTRRRGRDEDDDEDDDDMDDDEDDTEDDLDDDEDGDDVRKSFSSGSRTATRSTRSNRAGSEIRLSATSLLKSIGREFARALEPAYTQLDEINARLNDSEKQAEDIRKALDDLVEVSEAVVTDMQILSKSLEEFPEHQKLVKSISERLEGTVRTTPAVRDTEATSAGVTAEDLLKAGTTDVPGTPPNDGSTPLAREQVTRAHKLLNKAADLGTSIGRPVPGFTNFVNSVTAGTVTTAQADELEKSIAAFEDQLSKAGL